MKERKGEHPLGDMGQVVMLLVFLAVWSVDSFIIRATTVPSEYIPFPVRIIAWILLLGVGWYLFMSGHVVVRHDRRPEGVVSTGAFRYVRHPLYLASILFYLGLAVLTASLVSFALVVVIALFYNYLAGYEEGLLLLKYGEHYESYRNKTGKWIPEIRKWHKKP